MPIIKRKYGGSGRTRSTRNKSTIDCLFGRIFLELVMDFFPLVTFLIFETTR